MRGESLSPPWEVRDDFPYPTGKPIYTVQRGTGMSIETAATLISDYGLACVIEAVMNLRDGTVE